MNLDDYSSRFQRSVADSLKHQERIERELFKIVQRELDQAKSASELFRASNVCLVGVLELRSKLTISIREMLRDLIALNQPDMIEEWEHEISEMEAAMNKRNEASHGEKFKDIKKEIRGK